MEKWDELQKKEHILREKEDKLTKEIDQVNKIKELYEAHFHESGDFMSELHYTFYKNDGNHLYESIRDDYLQESRKIMSGLDEDQEALLKEKRSVQQQIDDVAYDKKKIALVRKEESSEY